MPDYKELDSWRIYHLYLYLFGRLAISRKPSGEPIALKIANRLGNKTFRKLVAPLFDQEGRWKGVVKQSNTVTTGAIVQMLSDLIENLKREYQQGEISYSQVLTIEDTIIALHKIIELTPQECEQLGLPKGDELTLLKQMLLTLRAAGGIDNYEVVFRAYKEAVGLDFSESQTAIETLEDMDALITKTVESSLKYLPEKQRYSKNGEIISPGKEDTIQELIHKAQQDIRRLLTRSGNNKSFLQGKKAEHLYIRHYLPPAFVQKLAQTVVSNERLAQQFPVFLKRVTMNSCGPLPFAKATSEGAEAIDGYEPLLNMKLQKLSTSPEEEETAGVKETLGPSDYDLAAQESVKFTVEFYMIVPPSYHGSVKKIFEQIADNAPKSKTNGRRVDFALTSTGIGGTLAHIIKVINLTLLRDIPCLGNFFPIAHDVTSTQQIIRDNVSSPVWAHSLVQLCYNQAIGQAIQNFGQSDEPYELSSFSDPIGHGDYCGFDFLLAQSQAALQARLQAVKNTGVNPEVYLSELCERTEKLLSLKKAWNALRRYPFSSMAMVGILHKDIIGQVIDEKRPLTKQDPPIYIDAYLSIAEAFLAEGAYRASYTYLIALRFLNEYVHQGLDANRGAAAGGEPSFEIFSGALIVRYLICVANYYYIYDREDDKKKRYLWPDCEEDVNRQVLIQNAWATLKYAVEHVEVRLKKYVVVKEPSQGIFSPHYGLLGKIFFERARLLTFFSQYVPEDRKVLPEELIVNQRRTEASTHTGRIYLIEKARLYAAADGDSETYACYAATQSYLYLAAAYARPEIWNSSNDEILERDECFKWAETLRNHALLTYAETGLQCYYDIKEKSGLPEETDLYEVYGGGAPYEIVKLPAILELRGADKQRLSRKDDESITLDISLLGMMMASEPDLLPKLTPQHPIENIYLFGTNACYLFLARGLYLLCSEHTEEFRINKAGEAIDWDKKLKTAIRLLNMAWAIAEDGCQFENIKRNENGQTKRYRRISRLFNDSDSPEQYTSQEISSVRDLYPRRVNEIADLGKIFSAACMALRFQIASETEQATIEENIDKILSMLHGTYRLEKQKTLKGLLRRQNRYNGHLQDYLSEASRIIKQSYQGQSSPEMNASRDELVTALFGALLGTN